MKKWIKESVKTKYDFCLRNYCNFLITSISYISPEVGFGPYILIACLLIFLGTFMYVTATKGISSTSKIAVGQVMFMAYRSSNSTRNLKYRISVAFPDKHQYVQKVRCDYETYNKVKMCSKVYICKGRVYTAE